MNVIAKDVVECWFGNEEVYGHLFVDVGPSILVVVVLVWLVSLNFRHTLKCWS